MTCISRIYGVYKILGRQPDLEAPSVYSYEHRGNEAILNKYFEYSLSLDSVMFLDNSFCTYHTEYRYGSAYPYPYDTVVVYPEVSEQDTVSKMCEKSDEP